MWLTRDMERASCDKNSKRKVPVYPELAKQCNIFLNIFLDKNIIKIYKNVYIFIKSVYFGAVFDIIISKGGVFYEILYITDEGKRNKKHK